MRHIFCVVYGIVNFLNPHILSNSICDEKNFCQSIGAIASFQKQVQDFLYQIASLGTGILQSCLNLDHCRIRNKIFIYW